MAARQKIKKLLIANRGEIAVRIGRAAREMSIDTVAVFSEDDGASLHVLRADEAIALTGIGAAAYLDVAQIVAAAKESGCDAVHPGYGFLSESSELATACEAAEITFVGPTPATLGLFGDKMRARAAAVEAGVPVLPASPSIADVQSATAFLESLPDGHAMIIKAVAGGGGRGMRIVRDATEIESSLERASSEAQAAFGNGGVYVEALVERALHIEVQIVGDGTSVVDLGERDCTIQRRFQKVVEIAPSPCLDNDTRGKIIDAAKTLAETVKYRNVGTFEFLVDVSANSPGAFYFIEVNPRIQVEHTVTEEVTGVDLVRTQIEIAGGALLADVGLGGEDHPVASGFAIQSRVNMEKVKKNGVTLPSVGLMTRFEPPNGPGIRVDTAGYTGYQSTPNYDSLLAKVIVNAGRGTFADVARRSALALGEFTVEGVSTNIGLLINILGHPEFTGARLYTRFIDDHLEDLVTEEASQKLAPPAPPAASNDPLAILNYGKGSQKQAREPEVNEGDVIMRSAMPSTIVGLSVEAGAEVSEGQELLVLSAMKMEHVISAEVSGVISAVHVRAGETIPEDALLVSIAPGEVEEKAALEVTALDLETLRPDLAEVERLRALTTDDSRRAQVEKRHAQGGRSVRENVDDLCDEGSFLQYGSLAVGASLRGTVDELLDYAPSDGLVMGLGHVNGADFAEEKSRCAVLAYDYSVLAGTQGGMNHKMMDRMFQVARRMELPVVLFSEGGGGRAGGGSRAARGGGEGISGGGGLNTPSWWLLGQISGLQPIVGINSGLCFAGNAALLGCCDVIIATRNSSIGMGGPAMIEGGGLGVYHPDEVGPMSIQVPNGVVDIAVEDEEEAVAVAKKYLSYFQGRTDSWECPDQRLLRHAIPENRLRVYDIRTLIDTLADSGSVLELRRQFGRAMVTAFARLEGRPVGIIANDPAFLSGAIDSDAADKAARFMKLCDAFDIPLLMLCDTPGIMVGPEAEKDATVRHAARMFVVGASVTVPCFLVILRKSYGLGAQAMGAGCHKVPGFTVAWPTSEFGGMGLEGQVKLGQRARLEAIEDPQERQVAFEKMVDAAYNRGKGLNAAHVYEIEDVIDPADTRRWVVGGLKASPPPAPRQGRKRPCVDTW